MESTIQWKGFSFEGNTKSQTKTPHVLLYCIIICLQTTQCGVGGVGGVGAFDKSFHGKRTPTVSIETEKCVWHTHTHNIALLH